ncbi:uncharacterized protein EI97DRAFT_10111 [Westerdykella ornata]|uniref:C2H2-type domain-containing protein n=1 Tax=Westerdykella ornata TaxID=318751 RepID=A0A6A6JW72_WESOR|nr:uncharacterized protein EI97DRAFT_10111 [Westerdykella ornata]KAF2280852.1 hypothetical protein EI97DRAFT_10111 [Westerdykella ornata]
MNTTAGLFNNNNNNNNNMGSTFVYYSPHPQGTAENSRHHGVFTPQPHPPSQLLQPGHAVMRSPSPYQSHAGGPLHAPQPMSQHRLPILGDVRPHPPQLTVNAPLTPYDPSTGGFGSPQLTPTTPALTHSCMSSPASVHNLPPTPVHEQCPELVQMDIVDAGIKTGRKEACDDVLVANAEIEPGFNPVYLSNTPKADVSKVELELPRSLLTPSPTPSPQSPLECPETVDPRALSLDFGNSSSGTVSPADIFGTPPTCSSPFSSPAFFSESTLGDFSVDTSAVSIAPEVTLWEDLSVADSALLPPSKRQRTSLAIEDHYFTDEAEDLRTGLLTPDSLSFSLSHDMYGFPLQDGMCPLPADSAEGKPEPAATERQSTVSQSHAESSRQQPSATAANGEESGVASASEDDAPPKRRGRKQSTSDDPSKPYSCNVCGVRFRRQEHLKRHIRSVHTKDRPFQCKDCGKLFSRSDNLTQHQRTHGAGAVVLGVRDPSMQETLSAPGFNTNQDPGQLGAILYQAADAISTSSSSTSESSPDDKKSRKRKRDS